jgi:preprotein translocase subunit SecA
LHLAVEAKEQFAVEKSANPTAYRISLGMDAPPLTQITLQHFFKLYPKLSGMTGTARSSASELSRVYGLNVQSIPTNKITTPTVCRDILFKTKEDKLNAVIEEVIHIMRHGYGKREEETSGQRSGGQGRPILIGTNSDKDSAELHQKLTERLRAEGIQTEVQLLNADQADQDPVREAEIIAMAGRLGAVTIATSMAGRGTDIKLGGDAEQLAKILLQRRGITADNTLPENYQELLQKVTNQVKVKINGEDKRVRALGGLYVIGTERSETRRVDDQLAGRCARQGDPGTIRFFSSVEDSLFKQTHSLSNRVFNALLENAGQEDIDKIIRKAQFEAEMEKLEQRKQALKFADEIDSRRKGFYEERDYVLTLNSRIECEEMLRKIIEGLLRETHKILTNGQKNQPKDWELLKRAAAADNLEVYAAILKERYQNLIHSYPAEVREEMAHVDRFLSLPARMVFWLDRLTPITQSMGGSAWAEDSIRASAEKLARQVMQRAWPLRNRLDTAERERLNQQGFTYFRQTVLNAMDSYWQMFLEDTQILLHQQPLTGQFLQKDPFTYYGLDVQQAFEKTKSMISARMLSDLAKAPVLMEPV